MPYQWRWINFCCNIAYHESLKRWSIILSSFPEIGFFSHMFMGCFVYTDLSISLLIRQWIPLSDAYLGANIITTLWGQNNKGYWQHQSWAWLPNLKETSFQILQTEANLLTSFIGNDLKILRRMSYWLRAIDSCDISPDSDIFLKNIIKEWVVMSTIFL